MAYNAPSAPTRATLAGNATSQVCYEEDHRYKKEHKYSAYLDVTSRDVLDHLMDRYGQIKPADLVENGINCTKLIDISQSIDAYFARIENCIQYASDGKTPYTAKQIITT
eukprot:1775566-Ditylum_brightwellii.AAC.1